MKNDKCKSTLVNDKVDNNSVVSVNPCVPVELDLLTEVVQSQVIACYNCIRVTLRHNNAVLLDSYVTKFLQFVTPRVALLVLQRCSLYEYRYTVVSNKDLGQIHSILYDFELTTCKDDNFDMLY